MQEFIIFVPISGILSLIIAGLLYRYIKKQPCSSILMTIEEMIHEGTITFLKRNYFILLIIIVAIFFPLWFFLGEYMTSVYFVSGSFCSLFVSHISLMTALRGNSRMAGTGDKSATADVLLIWFYSGSVMGLTMAGMVLIGFGIVFIHYGIEPSNIQSIIGFTFGASITALVIRICGGVFTQSAVMGMDLVEEIEVGIPGNDPRNPGVISKMVGKNISDISGMTADIFDSFTGAIIASIIIGTSICLDGGKSVHLSLFSHSLLFSALTSSTLKMFFVTFPALIVVVGLLGSLAGIFSIRYFIKRGPAYALKRTGFLAGFFFIFLSIIIIKIIQTPLGILWAILSGLLYSIFISLYSGFNNSELRINNLAEQSRRGPSILIISGFVMGMKSICLQVLCLCMAILLGYLAAGLYGICLCAIAMLALIGIVTTINAYRPLDDNSESMLKMAGSNLINRKMNNVQVAWNEKCSVLGEGFTIGATAFTALGLFIVFSLVADFRIIEIQDPRIVIGLFIGAIIPMVYTALCTVLVERTANGLFEEIRRQFCENIGLLEGKDRAVGNPKRCISLVSSSALRQIIFLGLLTLGCPAGVGFLLGKESLGGMLMGSTVIGVVLSFFMTNSGRALNNVKIYIENGHIGGKGSHNHRAAIIGDKIGTTFRYIVGPGMNILIKPMLAFSILIGPGLPDEGLIFWILGYFS